MITRTENKQIKFHMITIENLVPEKHFLRKLNRLVDFSFIYEETKDYYCEKNGRPGTGAGGSMEKMCSAACLSGFWSNAWKRGW